MTTHHLIRIWQSMEEPRPVTAVIAVIYAVAAFTGSVIAARSEWGGLDTAGLTIRGVTVLLMIAGGAIGALTSWRGVWWAERACTIAVSGAIVILTVTEIQGTPGPWARDVFIAVTALGLMLTRWFRVRRAPFAPGKGPLLPGQEAILDATTR